MSEQYSIDEAARRFHASVDWVPSRARSAIVIGAWLALTALFLLASVVLIGSVVTALGHSHGLASSLFALVGILGAIGIVPTVSWIVIAATVERFEEIYESDTDDGPSSLRLGSSGTNEQGSCRSSDACCC